VASGWWLVAGGWWSVATRQLRLTFVLVFLPLCASHLAVRCVSWPTRAMGSGALKYATKSAAQKMALWKFKLSWVR